MAVAFDAVGPSSAGTGTATATLSWTHTTGAGANVILVGVNLNDQHAYSLTATCNSVAMTSLGMIDVSGGTTPAANYEGYLQLFLATTSVTASSGNAIVVTCSGTPGYSLNGGSLSFSGYVSHGTVATGYTAATCVVPANTSGNIIAGFFAAGNTITQAGGVATGRFLENYEGNSAYDTGNSAGATAPATGSSVTITWTTSAGAGAICSMGLEMQGATGTDTSPAWAASYDTTAVAGTGTWTNPANAEGTGGSGGPWATWTAP